MSDTNIGELRKEQVGLKEQLSKLTNAKRECETKLNVIKNTIRASGRMPSEKYKAYCDSQNRHTLEILELEKRIVPIKNRLRQISESEFLIRFPDGVIPKNNGPINPQTPSPDIVRDLVELRQEYQNFAADGTRVSSMRQMAAEFVLKLNPIIRRQISDK